MIWALLIVGTALKSKLSRVLPSVGEMALDATASTFGDFVIGERCEEPACRPALLISLGGEIGPPELDGRQAQFGQQQLDAGGVDGICGLHATPPERTAPS
jgi:hypothetical protein